MLSGSSPSWIRILATRKLSAAVSRIRLRIVDRSATGVMALVLSPIICGLLPSLQPALEIMGRRMGPLLPGRRVTSNLYPEITDERRAAFSSSGRMSGAKTRRRGQDEAKEGGKARGRGLIIGGG